MSKTNIKNIAWNPCGENTTDGFNHFEIPDEFGIYSYNGELVSVNIPEQINRLYQGLPCMKTDKSVVTPFWFRDDYYGRNDILIESCHIKVSYTLGRALRKIHKVEQYLPRGTELTLHNVYVGYDVMPDGERKYYRLDLKYTTSRKHVGFFNDFKADQPKLSRGFNEDLVMNDFINFLRNNGFHVFVYENQVYESENPGLAAIAYGHGFKVGFSEFENPVFGYYNGRENVLFDGQGYFDKWSKCEEHPQPKTHEDFEEFLRRIKAFRYGENLCGTSNQES